MNEPIQIFYDHVIGRLATLYRLFFRGNLISEFLWFAFSEAFNPKPAVGRKQRIPAVGGHDAPPLRSHLVVVRF